MCAVKIVLICTIYLLKPFLPSRPISQVSIFDLINQYFPLSVLYKRFGIAVIGEESLIYSLIYWFTFGETAEQRAYEFPPKWDKFRLSHPWSLGHSKNTVLNPKSWESYINNINYTFGQTLARSLKIICEHLYFS